MWMTRTLTFTIALPALAVLSGVASIFAGPTAYADAPTHEIRKTEPKVAAGGHASASLTIAAKNGWHVNAEAPITVTLKSSDAGLTVAKEKMTRADLAESTKDAARFDIPLSCAADAAAGPKTINAEAKFVMCQESACKPVKETLALAIEVTPANAPLAAKKPRKASTK
jgi:hypothetical protein